MNKNLEKKKIVFILGSMGRGGAERVISILSKDFASRGWQTDICMLLFNKIEYELDSTTTVHNFSNGSGSRLKRLPYWLKTIRDFVHKENPDVIVSFTARINIITMLACLGLHKKIVISERNDPRNDGRGVVTNVLTNILYPHAHAIVFQTRLARDCFGNNIKKKSCIIPNPISVTTFAENTNKNKIVTVGRMAEQKNHILLLESFGDVLKIHPDLELTIYGDGNLRRKIQDRAHELNIADKVFLPGISSNVHEDIKDAAMFVLSSDYEGLSNALLEAMMMGIPCISTDCAGSNEYIENGVNGLLTPVGDRKALALAIKTFVEDDDLRQKCGQEAKKVSKKVSFENTIEQWRKVIE